jgi:7,8-dihydropterin-6-yl-methyl-4-(beta-D-ribofuranosyl)aminobenzene 5'-phosphate synthase
MSVDSITVVYDNTSVRNDIVADWGLSFLVRQGLHTILFDTGAKAEILSHNLCALYGAPPSVDAIFLSHDHFDHADGIPCVVPGCTNTCFIPASAMPRLGTVISSLGGNAIPIEKRHEIYPNMWSTGELKGSINEQSLVIRTQSGKLVLLTGCAHPGLVKIVDTVIAEFKEPPYLVMGGFHFFKMRLEEIVQHMSILRKLGVQKVAPCHCTGEAAISWMRSNWGEDFVEMGAGTTYFF